MSDDPSVVAALAELGLDPDDLDPAVLDTVAKHITGAGGVNVSQQAAEGTRGEDLLADDRPAPPASPNEAMNDLIRHRADAGERKRQLHRRLFGPPPDDAPPAA